MPRIAYIPPPIDFSDDRGRQIVSPMMANAQALMETFGTEIPRLRMQQEQVDTQKKYREDQMNMLQQRVNLEDTRYKDNLKTSRDAESARNDTLRNRDEDNTINGLVMATTPGALGKGARSSARTPVDKTQPTYRDWEAQAAARYPTPVDRRGHAIANDPRLPGIIKNREDFIARKQDEVESPPEVGLTDSQRLEGRRNFNQVMNWPEDRREFHGLDRAQLLRMDDLIRPNHVPLEESVDPTEMAKAFAIDPVQPAPAAPATPAAVAPVAPAQSAQSATRSLTMPTVATPSEPSAAVKATWISSLKDRYEAARQNNDHQTMQFLYDAMPDEVREALGLDAPREAYDREITPPASAQREEYMSNVDQGPVSPRVDYGQDQTRLPAPIDPTGGMSQELYNQTRLPSLREIVMARELGMARTAANARQADADLQAVITHGLR